MIKVSDDCVPAMIITPLPIDGVMSSMVKTSDGITTVKLYKFKNVDDTAVNDDLLIERKVIRCRGYSQR